jgi:fructose-1,6-bisphosphatase
MIDTKNSIIETLKVVKKERDINEGAIMTFDLETKNFIKAVVSKMYEKMGSYDLRAIDTLTNSVHKAVRDKLLKEVSTEITNQLKTKVLI